MRFKAKMRNDQLSVLLSVIGPISKLQQDHHRLAVMYLDEDYVRISCKQTPAEPGSGITCFAELSKTQLFVDHRIESASDNVIVVSVDLVSFKLALQSVVQSRVSCGLGVGGGGGGATKKQQQRYNSQQRSGGAGTGDHPSASAAAAAAAFMAANQHPDVVLKLAKRNNMPCLCLEGGTVRGMNDALMDSVEIHQAIPVRILRRAEMQHHLPPQINNPNVQLELPSDRPIRPVVDRLKALGKHVILEGTMKGELTVRLDNDVASMACFYHNLIPRFQEEDDANDEENYNSMNDDGDNNNKSNAMCRLKVDAHKLSMCLQWQQQQLPMTSCLLGMVRDEMLVLHILLYPEQMGFFTYYIPVQLLQEEDEY